MILESPEFIHGEYVKKEYIHSGIWQKLNKFDHTHFMGWLPAKDYASKVSAGVCSHNYELRRQNGEKYFPKFKVLTANSPILYEKIKKYNKTFYLPNGVHEDLFVENVKTNYQDFVVGWVGQETYGGFSLDDNDKIDIKGFQHILMPLVERLKNKVKFKILSKNYINGIPYKDMPSFYSDIDVQICTSFREGTPNPMFEAASSGKALISTKVGAISEFMANSGGGYLLDSYNSVRDISKTINDFVDKILYLKNNRELCSNMGKLNRKEIEKNWTWKKRAKEWKVLFERKGNI